ncbi:MAG TPA: S53 family peptidase [Gaiellaceae bacterium]|nr:S53 family peptidase [Gaiellaceae bacterium]
MLHRTAPAWAAVAAAFAFIGASTARADAPAACTSPNPVHVYPWYHCYTPSEITAAYGVNALQSQGILGQGQTIVLVDSYGSPTAASDLQFFHDTFYPSLPSPSFSEIYPNGQPDYSNVGNGQSGSGGAATWSGEATLDVEWSYAIAPLAHIVLIAVPPAETEGVQGFPNLFKAISDEIDATPAGTVFSMSFGVTEQTFGGAAKQQTASFDAVFLKGIAKGDTFFASSGDDGSLGTAKQHRDTAFYSIPTDGWPASSPYVTAVGGTQLQYGWTWAPTSDTPFNADGTENPAYFASTSGRNLNAVWNESWLPAASGGGPSAIYPRPSWQSGVAAVIGMNARGVPDLAWNAAVNGGALVYITAFPQIQRSGWHVYGGTSAASPQVAALTALAAQERKAAGKPPLGNINPLLYAHPKWFTDVKPVTEGAAQSGQLVSNRDWDYNGDGSAVTQDAVTGWPTLTGYDMTTGLGTPYAPAYVSGLAHS